ncbi:MAG: DUF2905 domain-containing protein [Ignavibacteria bacterium]
MQSIGKYIILLGSIILITGILITYFPKLNIFGKLTGDIIIKRENFSFYFPIVTSLVLSVILTLIFWLLRYFLRK